MERIIKVLKEFFVLTVGSLLCGVGIGLFLDPNRLAPGGVSGISIILSSVIPVETGSIIFMINIPLLIASWIWLGVACCFGLYTLISYARLKLMVRQSVRVHSQQEMTSVLHSPVHA